MAVTCPLGMRIPVGPVFQRNLVLFLTWSRHRCTSMSATAGLCLAGQPRAAVPTLLAGPGQKPGPKKA